ncbi:hypothetical protein [Lacimicrobium sp. SS2-24]|uniref:hypothetical protein n=1 Tax=Lacimicrobium sp. SS2-24 TaxID=2005569 RepID=UPI000B4AE6D3|nr:hypothetical protein [Lacimicrobium sp. SS2-24]
MFYVELVLSVAFVVLTVLGYKRNRRNMMLLGSICLVIAVSAEPFARGFHDGLTSAKQQRVQDQ